MELKLVSFNEEQNCVENVYVVSDDPKYRTKIFLADGSLSKPVQDIITLALRDSQKGLAVTMELVK
jgi:hypothetical protein